ncbi:MAG: cytochrome c [Planctomycetota bacterium]
MISARFESRLRNLNPSFPPRLFKAVLIAFVAAAFVIPLGLLALPFLSFLNDMAVQPKGKAQSLYGALLGQPAVVERPPVAGTMPMDFRPYRFEADDEGTVARAGQELANPLVPTMELLERGRKLFGYYCWTCHGLEGDGDGPIVGPDRFPAPPSLHTETARGFPDGRLYHVITRGQNKMPSYRDKFAPDERWAIIHYVRALQRARNPKPEDLDR